MGVLIERVRSSVIQSDGLQLKVQAGSFSRAMSLVGKRLETGSSRTGLILPGQP